ncbi:unnamed protein product [Leptosia nina]|uniref:ATP synthase F0 subunit 8 n=1 Tax=Leptosia nina TaxID=320188 RepID=A0AAV1JGL2_9NEOP
MVMGGTIRGARPPSHTAYYVALAGVVALLLLLCCYFIYFFIRRVKELSRQGLPERVQSVRPPPPGSIAYPVQPVVRASASAMARLCQSPASPASPASPRVKMLSPSRDRAIAQRSSSLTPAHTDTVHPRSHTNTLPPPTILTPRTTPIRNGPKTIPGKIELVSPTHSSIDSISPKSPSRKDLSLKTKQLSPRKKLPPVYRELSPKRRDLSPVWRELSMQNTPIKKDLTPMMRRKQKTGDEQRKHLSAPPEIVVGDA